MNTNANFIFDPVALQQQVNSLPPSWIPYVSAGFLVLMTLGRLLTSPANLQTAIKSVFLGSVHTATTSSVAAQSVGKPVTLPAPPQTVVVANPAPIAVVPPP